MTASTPPEAPVARDFHALAVQVARLDERTTALRTMVSGLYALVVFGFTILGWLVTRRGL